MILCTVYALALANSLFGFAGAFRTLDTLNAAIDTTGGSVGFLSEGNYHAVEHELSVDVTPVYFDTIDAMESAVNDGSVLAGLVSGTPDSDQFNTFPSEQVSVRAMFVKEGNGQLLDLLDRALVNIIESGGVERIARDNAPYRAMVVHSCKPSSDHFDWPTVANNTVIRVASLGPYDWGGTDGDYTVTPFVGFWPSYYEAIEAELVAKYNITLVRNWYPTSAAVLDSVVSGESDTTEPYMTVGAGYADMSRKSVFDMSCITSATQDMYFTKPVEVEAKSDEVIPPLVLAIGGVMVAAVIGLVAFVRHIRYREITGNPMFTPINTDDLDDRL
jgi:hypothetical protein